MAQVATPSNSRTNASLLDYQLAKWEALPEYASEWAELPAEEREVFHLEWVAITEQRLLDLQKAAERGLLSQPQQVRYQRLLALVKKHRPTLQRLLAE